MQNSINILYDNRQKYISNLIAALWIFSETTKGYEEQVFWGMIDDRQNKPLIVFETRGWDIKSGDWGPVLGFHCSFHLGDDLIKSNKTIVDASYIARTALNYKESKG